MSIKYNVGFTCAYFTQCIQLSIDLVSYGQIA